MESSKLETADFEVPSREQWLNQITKELKGAGYESIHWKHPELGEIPPILTTEDDVVQIPLPPRSFNGESGEWEIRQAFELEHDANQTVLNALKDGTSGIHIEVGDNVNLKTFSALFNDVYLNMVSVNLRSASYSNLYEAFSALTSRFSGASNELRGSIGADLLTEGVNQRRPFDNVAEQITLHVRRSNEIAPSMRSMPIEAHRVFEAGGSDALELAMALHTGDRYLNALIKNGLTIDNASALFEFSMSAGQSYFITIAKFRALRYAWAKLISEYHPEHACSMVTWIAAKTSHRNLAMNDKHSNLLRLTTASMGALTGGCDSLEISSFTPWEHNEESDRISRNIHHLLKEESWLDSVIDPGYNNKYISLLTSKLIDQALVYVREIEKAGGMNTQAGIDWLNAQIEQNKSSMLASYRSGASALMGVNKFAPEERVVEKTISSETGALAPFRIAEHLEGQTQQA